MFAPGRALAAAAVGAAIVSLAASPASASAMYSCPLTGDTSCISPLTGTLHGDASVAGDGYAFNPSGDGKAGYVQVDGSSAIDMTSFPITVSVDVKGVSVPSTRVGDYDVVRGTPAGNWKVEIVAKNNRTTARAACFFKGAQGKATASGGLDLSVQANWTTIACTDTGTAVELRVNGVLAKRVAVVTGSIPNPGPLLIGAKDTTGGDQFSGFARGVAISVP
jgi:hypothetical protein